MIDFRPIQLVIGMFVTAAGVLMVLPMVADLFAGNANWRAFGICAITSVGLGLGLIASAWGRIERITTRQGFLITTLSWVAVVAVAATPFILGTMNLSYTDALFEAMSGLTTTGATVVVGLDTAPPGFLLWRSILQWVGGVGVVIMAIAILPFLSVGGMQLFRLESSDPSDKFLPGASQIASAIMWLYSGFTFLAFLTYSAMGMSGFDAINHAMTTIATGGFSTRDASFGHYLSDPEMWGPVDLAATFFMIIGALPFGMYVLAVRGKLSAPLDDPQVRFFFAVAIVFTAVMMGRIMAVIDTGAIEAFRLAAFNVISIMTGTGYATTDYSLWGPFAVGFFFCVMFVGGCAGSTSCGLKIFRLQVAIAALALHAKRLAHPNRASVVRYNGRPIGEDVFISVLSFFFIYIASFATVAVLLSMFPEIDTITALSGAGSAIANVGPGLGAEIGPAGNYKGLPDGAKWVLSAAMLLGRLEFFTVLVLFAPGFWRR